jgi:quinol monooxygenase YgiN
MYGLFGKMRSTPGQREMLLAHLMQGVLVLRTLEGCIHYVIGTDPNDAEGIWISEVWRSQADHHASLNNDAIRQVITAARPLIAEMPISYEYTPLGGVGVPPSV